MDFLSSAARADTFGARQSSRRREEGTRRGGAAARAADRRAARGAASRACVNATALPPYLADHLIMRRRALEDRVADQKAYMALEDKARSNAVWEGKTQAKFEQKRQVRGAPLPRRASVVMLLRHAARPLP